VAAGVISWREKQVYRCDNSPDRSEQLANNVDVDKKHQWFEQLSGSVSLLHGVRSG
jgi:hypothetical protein